MWDNTLRFLRSAVLIFAFDAYPAIVFNVVADLFRREHKAAGWTKPLRVVFLIVLPYLTALVWSGYPRWRHGAAGARLSRDREQGHRNLRPGRGGPLAGTALPRARVSSTPTRSLSRTSQR